MTCSGENPTRKSGEQRRSARVAAVRSSREVDRLTASCNSPISTLSVRGRDAAGQVSCKTRYIRIPGFSFSGPMTMADRCETER